jgi:hypothetical protein
MRTADPEPAPPWGPVPSRGWSLACDLASAAVVSVVLALVLLTFRDYGITWDETWHLVYGDYILEWFLTLGADRSALCYRIDFLYGGAFDLLGAIARRFSPFSDFETIHLLGALVGVLGLLGTWRLARRLGGPVAGLVAVVLLAATPVYYGNLFNNPKDLPFAVGYVWAIDALCLVVLRMPRVPRRTWVRFAVLAGLAMSVRIAGILLLVYLAAVVVGLAWLRARATGNLQAGLATARRLGRPAGLAMLGAWVVMLLPWPWALLDPIRRPWMALGRMSRFTMHKRVMPFAGEDMLTTEPRWDYLLHYFGLQLPLVVLALVLAAVLLGGLAWRRHRERVSLHQRNVALVLGAAILAPPAYAIVVQAVLYDGLRHFLFLVPVIVVVAALGAVSLPRVRPRLARPARLGLGLGLVLGGGVLVARPIAAMRELHPNEYIYFNELIGGLPGAHGNYDTDYYGNSYKEAFAALAERLWHDERDRFLDTRYLVTGCIPDFVAVRYLEGNFAWVDKPSDGAEIYVGYTRSRCDERYQHRPELMRVERMGTLLVIVRDLRGGPVEDEDLDDGSGELDDADRPRTVSTPVPDGRRPRPRKPSASRGRWNHVDPPDPRAPDEPAP